jgi:hypothetical protein
MGNDPLGMVQEVVLLLVPPPFYPSLWVESLRERVCTPY